MIVKCLEQKCHEALDMLDLPLHRLRVVLRVAPKQLQQIRVLLGVYR